MPELPEVEYARKVAEAVACGQRIVDARVADDPIVYEGVAPAQIREALVDATVVDTGRRGKHLWLALDRRPWLLLHFGMTGFLARPGRNELTLSSTPATGEPTGWPPRFSKLQLRFEGGGELAVVNKRRLGRIRLRDDPEGEAPISQLGFDPLLDPPTPAAFFADLTRRRAVVKGLLLNQRFVAGTGNWIADEVLFQARVDPSRHAHGLSRAESDRIFEALIAVISYAVSVDADKTRFPPEWLFHRRWGRQEGQTTTEGQAIAFATVSGRTTAWVPDVQR